MTRSVVRTLGNPAAHTMTVAGRAVTYFADGAIITLDSGVDVIVSGAIWRRYAEGGELTGGYGLPLAAIGASTGKSGAEVPSVSGGGHQESTNAVLCHRGDNSGATVVWRGPLWDGYLTHGGPDGDPRVPRRPSGALLRSSA